MTPNDLEHWELGVPLILIEGDKDFSVWTPLEVPVLDIIDDTTSIPERRRCYIY
jgi:hypothetical protein